MNDFQLLVEDAFDATALIEGSQVLNTYVERNWTQRMDLSWFLISIRWLSTCESNLTLKQLIWESVLVKLMTSTKATLKDLAHSSTIAWFASSGIGRTSLMSRYM